MPPKILTRSAPAADTQLVEPTLGSYLRGLREAAQVATRPRFSIAKAQQCICYLKNSSVRRQVFVVCASPVAGLVASIVPSLLPLQDPSRGVQANSIFYVHLTLTIAFTATSAIVGARDMTGLTRAEYPNWAVGVVSTITTALLVAMFAALGVYWRFPVPFAPVLIYVPWLLCIIFAHIATLRGRLKTQRVRNHLLFYLPSLSVQVSQLVIYPAYSALFNASHEWLQVVLIGVFPVLKFILKKNIYIANHHVRDYAREEAVSAVEICASMYQSMIVQGTPSPVMTGLVIAVDVVLGVLDIKRLVNRTTVLPDVELVHAGIKILQQQDTATRLTDEQLQPFATKTIGYFEFTRKKIERVGRQITRRSALVNPLPVVAVVPGNKRTANDAATEKLVLTQSLELLQALETIMLIEYLEVVIPIMNAVYVVASSQLPSAIYNAKLRPFVGHSDELVSALANMLLYSILQGGTLVAACAVIRMRYGLSPLAQIAFALEKHFWALQGKMVAWLPTILAFSIAHYGVDFTFKFDFRPQPLE